jgi:acyl-CoA carboxylase epsilon subunit
VAVAEQPLLRVVRGNPDDTELAALTAVVATVASVSGDRTGKPPSRRSWWADRAAMLRSPVRPGEGAWRASSLPR